MDFHKTDFPGLFIIEPRVFQDARGYFFESFRQEKFSDESIEVTFVQDNESKSSYGVIRGLHYQLNPFAQAKLVRVIQGAVFDVAVDLRKGSPTFGKWFGMELNAENKKQLFIPRGFAHGFSVLTETAVFSYKCDNYYNKNSERSIRFDDAMLNIDWKIEGDNRIISEKDLDAPVFKNAEINFKY